MFKVDINSNLHLELLDLAHAKKMFELGQKNKDEFIKWLPWVEKNKSVEDTKEFIKQSLQNYAKGVEVNCSIFYNSELVGNVSLGGIKKKLGIKKGVIGYWLDSNFQKRGIMNKSVAKILEIGFEKMGLDKVLIHCDKDNINSCSVAIRANFKLEGLLREDAIVNGKVVDLKQFSLLKKEYFENKNIC